MLKNYDISYVEYPHEVLINAATISDITTWVNKTYSGEHYDFMVGHSLGGIIALELMAEFKFPCDKIIFIDSNLQPANEFYRNLMTPEHMKLYAEQVMSMMKGESRYYQESLKKSLQVEFDYTGYVKSLKDKVYAIYGDRGVAGYEHRISDLCLDEETISKIEFMFVEDSCHMPMIENPEVLGQRILSVLESYV